jgi:hypothetical protein
MDVRAAQISACGRYRYTLRRAWMGGSAVVWLLLNPSTADASLDDPTVRRMRAFSMAWGYGSMRVVNLFALRSPHPCELTAAARRGIDPVGPGNDAWIEREAEGGELVVAGWGVHGLKSPERVRAVLRLLQDLPVWCLGVTSEGAPRHPLYVKGATELEAFPRSIASNGMLPRA